MGEPRRDDEAVKALMTMLGGACLLFCVFVWPALACGRRCPRCGGWCEDERECDERAGEPKDAGRDDWREDR